MLVTEAFGNKIRELRTERGLTQQQLADLVVVSRYTVANWEAGKRLPDVSTISRISLALHVEDHVLLDVLRDQEEKNPHVIVVEDVPVILKNCVHTLSNELPDAQVLGFSNAAETLAFARANRVSIAFLDIELCGEDGLQLAKDLLAIDPRTNIIFLTSHAEYAVHAHELYCSGYVLKPLTPERIRSEISHLRFPVRGLKP